MKFAVILREAGFNTNIFEKCSQIPIVLYDGKNRIDMVEDVRFVKALFVNNSGSFIDFYEFLKELENKTEEITEPINVKIDANSVVVFYKTPHAKVFSRNQALNPIDYMD